MNNPNGSQPGDYEITEFNAARPFSSFLPGISGSHGKPLWAFYTNRGQCISSFGTRDKDGSILEFHPANKAYALTPLLGFRTFLVQAGSNSLLHEPFQLADTIGRTQRLVVRPEEIEIEEVDHATGLRINVCYFTLPNETLPALVRNVTVENIGSSDFEARVLDGLPQIVPFGLKDLLLKSMSRTMEAFAEIRGIEERLPFFKLKTEPSDKPEIQWINGGHFSFTIQDGQSRPVVVDPDLVFGYDTSFRTPSDFLQAVEIDANKSRVETLTGCAFAQIELSLRPGQKASWSSFFGQAATWESARELRDRILKEPAYTAARRGENTKLIHGICDRFSLIAGPAQLGPYTRQTFLDNTLRGGEPIKVGIESRSHVFHTFTRKHGDMERDYNFFELAPTYWSQGNGNFRDVSQNRRSENFVYPEVGTSNIEAFFDLIQLDGNNPLVIQAELFRLSEEALARLGLDWDVARSQAWQEFLLKPFSPGQLAEALDAEFNTPSVRSSWFQIIISFADKIQDAKHGEGYWVDHWTYNFDLLDSYAALYPDRLRQVIFEDCRYTYYDNEYIVVPRSEKYVLREDGTVRQLHAVVKNKEKARLIASREVLPTLMRDQYGSGQIFRSTLFGKILGLLVVKATLLDPFGVGLEMEAEKPGWCDALNGLPGLMGSSSHEAFALKRAAVFARDVLREFGNSSVISVPIEVADLIRKVTDILTTADADDFYPSWDGLASAREEFRAATLLGSSGATEVVLLDNIEGFIAALLATLERGLARAVDRNGLPISYFVNEVTQYEELPAAATDRSDSSELPPVHVRALQFRQLAVTPFLEGAVQALRNSRTSEHSAALYAAVRKSMLFDEKLAMYRVNAPLDEMSYELGRITVFSPGWLENESVFLHMHYKYLLELLRSGLHDEFFGDLRQGLVAFLDPTLYGRSPLENSSFIASSRFSSTGEHGRGFVARLSGATAEWISMVLHMGLGAKPFVESERELRFQPVPVLANWLFTNEATEHFEANSFGLKLFGTTWVVYRNPLKRSTYGPDSVAPVSFRLEYKDRDPVVHIGAWLPHTLAHDLRNSKLAKLFINLG